MPLLLVWQSGAKKRKVLTGVWVVCIVYVSLLALNLLRSGFLTKGIIRLSLWIVIGVLVVRMLRQAHQNA